MFRAWVTASTIFFLGLGALSPGNLRAQEGWDDSGGAGAYRPEELDQMFAPVALYPDSLLSKVLMAATYPSEIEEAARFAYDNSGLDGQTLSDLATGEDWDPSVKALLSFPDILGMLSDRIDWTRDMGDAFLGQQREVMDSVQRLRSHAYEAGNLKTTPEMQVRTQSGAKLPGYNPEFIQPVTIDPVTIDPMDPIVIEPVSFDSYSVPVYDPDTVYGDWWWSGYPPYYYYPPAYSPGTGIGFWTGVAVGKNWDWSGWDWKRHEATIDGGRYSGWAQSHYASPERYKRPATSAPQTWRHDASHRREEPYRDQATAMHYGRGDSYRDAGRSARNYSDRLGSAGGDRGFDRGAGGTDRRGDSAGNRAAFDRPDSGGGDRAASFRGQVSRGMAGGGAPSRPAGGGGRRR